MNFECKTCQGDIRDANHCDMLTTIVVNDLKENKKTKKCRLCYQKAEKYLSIFWFVQARRKYRGRAEYGDASFDHYDRFDIYTCNSCCSNIENSDIAEQGTIGWDYYEALDYIQCVMSNDE